MSDIVKGAQEALEIARGERPASCLWHKGHEYVPKVQWQPIETAPELLGKGQSAIVFAHGVIITALFVGSGWMSRGEQIHPTHWMPLPEPPKETPHE